MAYDVYQWRFILTCNVLLRTLTILIICHASWFDSVPELVEHHGLHPQEIYEGVQLLVPVHFYIRGLYCEAVILYQLPTEAVLLCRIYLVSY